MPGISGSVNACHSVTWTVWVGPPMRTFAHEIGHNLGAGHFGKSGAEPAAQGWRYVGTDGKNYRTQLSYQEKANETRIPYYSNPAKSYQGKPTGTASANNSATISKLAKEASGYK